MLYLRTNLRTSILSKKVAISQSNYIPWKGYFDNIALVDEFVLYDDVQYTKRDWRNRNKIKTSNGLKWLTVPVEVKGKYYQKIRETKVSQPNWSATHLAILKNNYVGSKAYDEMIPVVENWYKHCERYSTISEINYYLLTEICAYLGIQTKITFSSDYNVDHTLNSTERLVDLCLQLGAGEYYSGSAAKNYMDEELFENKGITIHYFDYSNYPEYDQQYPPFVHEVSILDVLFSLGSNSKKALKFS